MGFVQELITVVVPIYNVEKYLTQCIESIIGQTYKNLEIILIDDGATDNSGNIADRFSVIDSRINVIHQKNSGLSAARNAGIDIARGKYITFVDSDDVITNDMIEHLYTKLKYYDTDISVCQKGLISEKGKIMPYKSLCKSRVVFGNENCMEDFFLYKDIDTVAWGKLYRMELFDGIRYPEGKYHEDVYVTYLIIAKCVSIYISCEQKYLYRKRDNSIMNSEFSLKYLDGISGSIERAFFIENKYPQLNIYAKSGIICAVNVCVMKILYLDSINSDVDLVLSELQKLYRKYFKYFIRGRSCINAKLFSVMAFINLKCFVKIGSKIVRSKKVR